MFKRLALLSAVIAASTMPIAIAQESADAYPSGPVTIVVPYSAGGGNDIIARIVAEMLESRLGQRFLVENRPGAGSAVGSAYVAARPADGYTLLFSTSQLLSTNLTLREPNYAIEDFTPVALVSAAPEVLVVNADLPIHSVDDLVAYAKERPGQLSYGSVGTASNVQISSATFARDTGIEVIEVPFGGGSDVMRSLMSGEVHFYFGANIPSAAAGGENLRFLAITSDERSSFLPDLPTLTELGYPIIATPWSALFAHVDTPPDILEKLRAVTHEVVNSPEMEEALNRLSLEPYRGTAEDFQVLIDEKLEEIEEIIEIFGIVPE